MKEEKKDSKSAGDAIKEKQSAIDNAVNKAAQDGSDAEDTRNRNRRDHSEKVSGKGSKS